jgi:hypothetical protein
MKKWLVVLWLVAILATISYIFWHEDWKYSLPTPVPTDYEAVKAGELVNVGGVAWTGEKPLFLHFFNPACPCSRFNIPQVRELVGEYKDQMDFAIVVTSKDRSYTEEEIRDKFSIDVPIYFDKAIADSCGVYSTPQAVVIDKDSRLFYRGNYNKTRYCTEKATNYAQMAIDSLLGNANTITDLAALQSYGCALPDNCTR